RTLDHTRVTIAAQAVGIAQGALDYALDYVKERQQFGKAVAANQGIQVMLADMGMTLEAARQVTSTAAAERPRLHDALTYFGAAGYVVDHPVERMMRDAKITQIYEGTNQIQRMVMGRQLLR